MRVRDRAPLGEEVPKAEPPQSATPRPPGAPDAPTFPSAGRRDGLRPEIQALRALAIAMVVAYHLSPGHVRGGFFGVDAFFLISGFLISAHLASDVIGGARSPFAFWARRIRRIIPAAFVTLLVTSVVIVTAVPERLWRQFLGEVLASTAYFENWRLAADAVNYFGSGNPPSPVQHFWTLSVEEQFYVAWPLLLIGVAVAIRPRRPRILRLSFLGLALVVTLTSFAYTVHWTDSSTPGPYYWASTRAWEFALGGVLAFVGPVVSSTRARGALDSLARSVGAIASWLGWVALIVTSFAFDSRSDHPGWATVLPVGGAALVILGGNRGRVASLRWVVESRPVQYLGAISYSLYLWHWPVLILAPFLLAAELGARANLAALLVSLALAAASYRWIEQPVIHGHPRWIRSTRGAAIALAAGMAITATVPILGIRALTHHEREYERWIADRPAVPATPDAAVSSPCFGAVAARWPATCVPTGVTLLVPSTSTAGSDNGAVGSIPGCHVEDWYDATFSPCEYVGGAGTGARVIVLGDSHARPLLALVSTLADRLDWRVTYASKGHCPYSDALVDLNDPRAEQACATWLGQANDLIASGDFDLLITSQKRGERWITMDGLEGNAAAVAGLEQTWSRAVSSHTRVLAIEDNPGSRVDIQACLEDHAPDDYLACGLPRTEALGFDPQLAAAAAFTRQQVRVVSFTDLYCDGAVCAPVIGGVNVYRDGDHLTATWAGTLVPVLLERVPIEFLTAPSGIAGMSATGR